MCDFYEILQASIMAQTAFITNIVASFIFALVTHFRFNSIRVFDKTVQTANLSNTLWAAYFLISCVFYLSYVVVHYAIGMTSISRLLIAMSFLLQGLTTLLLALSLQHQQHYRSKCM